MEIGIVDVVEECLVIQMASINHLQNPVPSIGFDLRVSSLQPLPVHSSSRSYPILSPLRSRFPRHARPFRFVERIPVVVFSV